MKYLVIFIPFIILFNSCATSHHMVHRDLDNPIEKDLVRLDNDNFNKLNGTYYNKKDKDSPFLWGMIVLKTKSRYADLIKDENAFIRLKMLDKRHIEVSLILDDTVRIKRKFSGKVMNGLFIVRNQNSAKGVPPFFFLNFNEVVGLGINKNGNLLLGKEMNNWGLIVGMPIFGGVSGWNPDEYVRKSDSL